MNPAAAPPLYILQNGIPRSGNLWLHYLLRQCLKEAGVVIRQNIENDSVAEALAGVDLGIRDIEKIDFIRIQPLRCFSTILDIYQWPIEDLDSYVRGSTHTSSHSSWNEASASVYARFSHVIYIIRDPRDAAVSMARFACTPFNKLHRPHAFTAPKEYLDYHLSSLIDNWTKHVGGHLQHRDDARIHFVMYERLLDSPQEEITDLTRFLGLDLEREQLDRVLAKTSFGELKQVQPNHLVAGSWGQWRDALSSHQVRQARSLAGPLLEYFGYPPDNRALGGWSLCEIRSSPNVT